MIGMANYQGNKQFRTPNRIFVKLFTGLKVIPNLPPCFENTGTSDSRLLCEEQPSSLNCSPSSTGM